MTKPVLIVGDVAGRYTELMELFDQARDILGEYKTIIVGDLVDRGPDSDKIIQFLIDYQDEKGIISLMGNHEHMFLDYVTRHAAGKSIYYHYYYGAPFLQNGGKATLKSYTDENGECLIPKEHISFLRNLPTYYEHKDKRGKFIVTHAPINPVYDIESLKTNCIPLAHDHSFIWNRGKPRRIEGVMQFHGHNTYRNVKKWQDKQGVYAMGVDTADKITGVVWPTSEIISVDYKGG